MDQHKDLLIVFLFISGIVTQVNANADLELIRRMTEMTLEKKEAWLIVREIKRDMNEPKDVRLYSLQAKCHD